MSNDFKSEFSRMAVRQVENNTGNTALLHVALPLAIALLGVSTTYLWSKDPIIPIALWAFLALFYGFSWWKSHPTYTDIHRLLLHKQNDDLKIEELTAEIRKLESIGLDLNYKNMASFIFRVMSYEYIKEVRSGNFSSSYFSEILDEILSPFYLQGDAIFGFLMSEQWSISVYIFDEDQYILKPVWRQKSSSHPSKGLGREWIPGEGHVGKAFLDRRPILTGNANDEAVAQLCRSRGSKQLGYDQSTYVSFASVPIAVSRNDDDNPFGVLVVSSNREERLSEESTELLMHAAQTIAVILDLSDVDTGCLVNPNHDISNLAEGDKDVGSAQKA